MKISKEKWEKNMKGKEFKIKEDGSYALIDKKTKKELGTVQIDKEE